MNVISHKRFGPYDLKYMSDGILYVNVSKEPEATIEWLAAAVPIIGEMVNGQKVPMVTSFSEFALPSKTLREFWAKEESCPYIMAEAYIIDSFALKLIGNFYMNVNKPERPTKLFTNHDDAITWLHKFI